MTQIDPEYEYTLTVAVVLRRLGISHTALMRRDEQLKPIRTPGGHRRYRPDVVEAYLEQRRARAKEFSHA